MYSLMHRCDDVTEPTSHCSLRFIKDGVQCAVVYHRNACQAHLRVRRSCDAS